MRNLRRMALGGLLSLAALATGSAALAQEGSAAEIGQKLSDPLSDIWALFTEIDYIWKEGDFTNGKWRSGQSVILQPIMPFRLTENYKLITRPTLPVVRADIPVGRRYNSVPLDDLTEIVFPDGSAAFDDKTGLGDMTLPLLVSRVPDPGQRWSVAYGATLGFPTATEKELGTDTWEIGPAAALTYKNEGLSAGVLGQYWWNYAESGNDVQDTSHGAAQYWAWWSLPQAWQVGTSATIVYNHEAASDNKWNVPASLGVAKTVKFGKMPVKFQLAVEKSFIREKDYGTDWKIKLNIIPVIPALVKRTLF